MDINDPNMLKQVLVNCNYILNDTSTDQKTLERNQTKMSGINSIANFQNAIKRRENSVIGYRPNINDHSYSAVKGLNKKDSMKVLGSQNSSKKFLLKSERASPNLMFL